MHRTSSWLYLISCHCSGDDRPAAIVKVISGLAHECWSAGDNAWVIQSNAPATTIRDHLKVILLEGETALVALLAGHAAWHGYQEADAEWLLAHL